MRFEYKSIKKMQPELFSIQNYTHSGQNSASDLEIILPDLYKICGRIRAKFYK